SAYSNCLDPFRPRRTISSTWVLRIETRANSPATKMPLRITRAGTLKSRSKSASQLLSDSGAGCKEMPSLKSAWLFRHGNTTATEDQTAACLLAFVSSDARCWKQASIDGSARGYHTKEND